MMIFMCIHVVKSNFMFNLILLLIDLHLYVFLLLFFIHVHKSFIFIEGFFKCLASQTTDFSGEDGYQKVKFNVLCKFVRYLLKKISFFKVVRLNSEGTLILTGVWISLFKYWCHVLNRKI